MNRADPGATIATRPDRSRASAAAQAASWLAAIAIVVVLVRSTPLAALRAALENADPGLLTAAAALALFAEIYLASEKYRCLVALLGAELPLGETIVLRMGSFLVLHVLPFKSGELLRMSYLKRRYGLSLARSGLATILNAGSDALVFLAYLALGLVLRSGAVALVPVLVGVGAGLLAVWVARRPSVAPWLARRFGDDPFRGAVARGIWAASAWTIALVSVDLVIYAVVLRAFHLPVPPSAIVLLVPMVVIAAGLPVTPMGFGVREAAVSLLLAPYGRPEELLSAALAASAIMKLLPAAAGIPFLRPLLRRLLDRRAD